MRVRRMASRVNDSDGGGSSTPSEQSDGEERSEHDSDYETDDGKGTADDSRDKKLNIIWTGYAKRTPVALFNVSSILESGLDFKAVGEQYHLAFKFGGAECKIIRKILLAHGFHEVHPNCADYNLLWTNSHLKPFTLRSLTEFQKINHFPRSYELTRKDRLYKNIQRMQQIKGVKHFDFMPQSFVMPGEYQEFCSYFLKDRGPWIVKPVASSRGRGVFLINHPDQVPLDENLIVSHYLHNPLVIDGFKFDVRLYVSVTSYDPLVIYLYEEGLTRFATVKYERSTKHIRNQCMHLTNYSVNKKSNDYVKNDDPDVEDYGNKWSMGAMLRYLRSMGKDTAALMMRIEDVVIKTLLSVELSIATACKMFMPFRGNCFELYGFDILVDDTLKPWVLEVNLSPSLACDSPLDLKIKGNMLCDLFSLTGIVCHDPMVRSIQQQTRRNQDLVAKMANRAKTAYTRQVLKLAKIRPQSANYNARQGFTSQGPKTGMTGLNSEEIKIVRRVKEEELRRGGWIRIFPGPDTWDVHGPFLQFSTTHNLMLHQRLYPDRHKMTGLKTSGSVSSAASRSRTGYLQVTGTGQRLDTEQKAIESYALALIRARQYERKLGSRSKRRKRKDTRAKLVQGISDDLEEGENQSGEEEMGDERGKQHNTEDKRPNRTNIKTPVASSQESQVTMSKPRLPQPPQKPIEVKVQEVKVEAHHQFRASPVPVKPAAPPDAKFDVVEMLANGGTLSKVQARSAFAMYLVRVQQRLVSEMGPLLQEDVDILNEQMDLVLRFLKRAAVNLQQTFRVVVPSRKLPLGDRRRILAKQLADFVHIYNKETEQLKQQIKAAELSCSHSRLTHHADSLRWLDDSKFCHFTATASEGDLEEVLTTYTKLNKSASIFLGSISASSSNPTKPPHNPLPAPSAQRAEMLQRRREAGEGDSKASDDHIKHHSTFSMDMHATKSTGSLSRPPSASSSSYVSAVSIYSQRLSRPHSATNFKAPAMKVASRPSSAYGPKVSPFSTTEPVVDTYNEQAIRQALQRLAVKQQARQYSSINTTNNYLLSDNNSSDGQPPPFPPPPTSHRRGSLTSQDEAVDLTVHPGSLQIQRLGSRPPSGSGSLYSKVEDYDRADHQKKTERVSSGRLPLGVDGAKGDQTDLHQGNVHYAMLCSRSEEDGPLSTKPDGQTSSSVPASALSAKSNRHIQASSEGWQKGPQQRLPQDRHSLSHTEQRNHSYMESKKAKHQAMVAQAHAAQKGAVNSRLYREGQANLGGVESSIARGTPSFSPKPPAQPVPPRSKLASTQRFTRLSSADDGHPLNLTFHNSLHYDIHMHQLRRKADSRVGK